MGWSNGDALELAMRGMSEGMVREQSPRAKREGYGKVGVGIVMMFY